MTDISRLVLVIVLLASVPAGAAAAGLPRLAVPQPAPEFELQDTRGDIHRLAGYRGQVLVINFWATWCPPCVKEMPALQNAWQQLRVDGVQILAINLGEPAEVISEFLEKYPVDFPVLLDRDLTVATAWEVRGLPTTFIIDHEGAIVIRVVGERQWNDPDIVAQIRSLRAR